MRVEDNQIFRVSAVADLLDVHRATIYRAIESGALDALKIGTGKGALRIPGYAVNAYLNSCAEAAYTAHVVEGRPVADDVAPALTDAEANGLACVVCGVDFLRSGNSHIPVGVSETGSQIFACVSHKVQVLSDQNGEVG
jgi:excisionase family DNA binding protein